MYEQKQRCAWLTENLLYLEYHDKEWGTPLYDDDKLFEFLTLESAQAGLSWITVLKKREHYRKAFKQFDPVKVAAFRQKDVDRLMQNAGIIRNAAKIKAAINNAGKFLEVQSEFGSFAEYQYRFVGGKPKINKWKTMKQIPAITAESEAFAKNLKQRGFNFLGPTTIYAHMQASGMVNDHTMDCFRYAELSE